MDYQSYLRSPEWQARREERLQFDDYKCVRCGQEEFLKVHHLTYVHLGRELMEDLQTLCGDCHGIAHGIEPSGGFKEFLRNQKRYRKIFLEHYGPFPHLCYFCDGEVDGHTRPCNSTAAVVHHIDGYPTNYNPSNLAAAHWGCHTRHHHLGSDLSKQHAILAALRRMDPAFQNAINAKISSANTANWADPDFRDKMISAQTDPKVQARHREIMHRPDVVAKMRGRKWKPESKAGMSDYARNRPLAHRTNLALASRSKDPDVRARIAASIVAKPYVRCPYCSREVQDIGANVIRHIQACVKLER